MSKTRMGSFNLPRCHRTAKSCHYSKLGNQPRFTLLLPQVPEETSSSPWSPPKQHAQILFQKQSSVRSLPPLHENLLSLPVALSPSCWDLGPLLHPQRAACIKVATVSRLSLSQSSCSLLLICSRLEGWAFVFLLMGKWKHLREAFLVP